MYTELFNAVIPTLFSSFLLFCYPYTLYLFTWFFSTQVLFESQKTAILSVTNHQFGHSHV